MDAARVRRDGVARMGQVPLKRSVRRRMTYNLLPMGLFRRRIRPAEPNQDINLLGIGLGEHLRRRTGVHRPWQLSMPVARLSAADHG